MDLLVLKSPFVISSYFTSLCLSYYGATVDSGTCLVSAVVTGIVSVESADPGHSASVSCSYPVSQMHIDVLGQTLFL